MKLMIRKKFFDQILNDEKPVEFRDAHITFVCEDTGRTLRKDVLTATVIPKKVLPVEFQRSNMFQDDHIIAFHLKKPIWQRIYDVFVFDAGLLNEDGVGLSIEHVQSINRLIHTTWSVEDEMKHIENCNKKLGD